MWQYRHTDQMYCKNNDELYHSNTYLGNDFSDGIQHHKYVKKYPNPNGKGFIYVYKKGNTTLGTARTAGKTGSKYGTFKTVGEKNGRHYEKITTTRKSNKLFGSTRTDRTVSYNRETVKVYHDIGRIERGVVALGKAIKKLAKKTKKAVNKGKKAVKNFLKKAFPTNTTSKTYVVGYRQGK